MNKTRNILLGWGQIEFYAGESRTTLIRKNFPIQKDSGGSVWANKAEIDRHRKKISSKFMPQCHTPG